MATGGQGNAVWLFLITWLSLSPASTGHGAESQDGAALSAAGSIRLNQALLCEEALFWGGLVPVPDMS